MAATGDADPLPRLTAKQIRAWDTEHLDSAAQSWRSTADRWRDNYTAVNTGILRPGGTDWLGAAADAASARTDRDRSQVVGLAERLLSAADVARRGASDIAAAKRSTLAAIDGARRAGFTVSDDLAVRDNIAVQSKPARLIRDLQRQVFAADIRAQALQLAATDRVVAARLHSFSAGFGSFEFPASPAKEPTPPKIPMPPYQPRVWGACKLGGGNPDKVVRTFHRAPLVAGVSAMPGGDSVLHCGNDKFGFHHMVKEHGAHWQSMAIGRFPGGGNWRDLADYSISATLAHPEKVVYDSQRDTFAVYRNIYRLTDDGAVYAFTARVVVSGTDGKIITAFPSTSPV